MLPRTNNNSKGVIFKYLSLLHRDYAGEILLFEKEFVHLQPHNSKKHEKIIVTNIHHMRKDLHKCSTEKV